ncbi:MAG: matrixin family metalloprotease [Actinobacteria bacterium]|nr:matrixin family metalloprotease [Actinomycetota bacterium]
MSVTPARRLLASLAGLGLLAGVPPAAADPGSGTAGAATGLRPGAVVRIGGLAARVPPPGSSVFAVAESADGEPRTLRIETLPDGTVVVDGAVTDGADGGSAGPSAAKGGKGPVKCSDDAHVVLDASWTGTLRWYYRAASTPRKFSADRAAAALRRAATNITRADNECDLPDTVSASHSYLGTTTRGMNIGAADACRSPDGVSVVGFGNLGAGTLAMACWWTTGGVTVEADIRLNKADYRWVIRPGGACVRRWSVEAVATHEFGHAFGLDHVSEKKHPELTMSPLIDPCQDGEKSLGLGDVLGLDLKY